MQSPNNRIGILSCASRITRKNAQKYSFLEKNIRATIPTIQEMADNIPSQRSLFHAILWV